MIDQVVYMDPKKYYALYHNEGKPLNFQYLGNIPDWARTFSDGKTLIGSGINAAKDNADQLGSGDYEIIEEGRMIELLHSMTDALLTGRKDNNK